jgi:hypothetical protein
MRSRDGRDGPVGRRGRGGGGIGNEADDEEDGLREKKRKRFRVWLKSGVGVERSGEASGREVRRGRKMAGAEGWSQ